MENRQGRRRIKIIAVAAAVAVVVGVVALSLPETSNVVACVETTTGGALLTSYSVSDSHTYTSVSTSYDVLGISTNTHTTNVTGTVGHTASKGYFAGCTYVKQSK